MIGEHPGGIRLTRRLLELASVTPPAKVLDLGAGEGVSVRYLKELGYDAEGIDEVCPGVDVAEGDMRKLLFSDDTFDICLAECSVSVCGDGPAALRESYRVLKLGGSLLLSDVFFRKEQAPCLSMPAPLTMACWERESMLAGFTVRAVSDETALWKDFFLESLWNGNADADFCSFFKEAGKAGCGYFLAWLRKGEEDGFI